MNIFSGTWCCLVLFLLVVSPGSFVSGIFVREENTADCEVTGEMLNCDFKFATEDVRISESVNKFKTVALRNANRLVLRNGLCTALILSHISSVIYGSGFGSQAPNSCNSSTLYLHNVLIDYIPPFLSEIRIEKSRVSGGFHPQPFLKNLKITHSFIQSLKLHHPVGGDGNVLIHNTTIAIFLKLELTTIVQLYLTDSVIQHIASAAVILSQNTSAKIMRTTFVQPYEFTVFLDEAAQISFGENKGLFSVHRKKTSNEMKVVEENVPKIQECIPVQGETSLGQSSLPIGVRVHLTLLWLGFLGLIFVIIGLVIKYRRPSWIINTKAIVTGIISPVAVNPVPV